MATLSELVERGNLIRYNPSLSPREQSRGLVYLFPHVRDWMRDTLPDMEPILDHGRLSPIEQVDALLHDFVVDEDLSYYERSHCMRPEEPGVWELKTEDVRLIGWFKLKRVFVIAEADSAFRIKTHGLYAGYRDSTLRRRQGLDLDEPRFISGGYDDVL